MWLIRTKDNWIAGPYTQEQVCEMIQEEKLGPEDEVCPANGYWFYLYEQKEVRKYLGIEVERKPTPGEEVTESGVEDEVTDPQVRAVAGTLMKGAVGESSLRVGPASSEKPTVDEGGVGGALGWVVLGIGLVVCFLIVMHVVRTS